MTGLIHHTPTRRAMLAITALVFAGLAVQTLIRPDLVAQAVGNGLRSANDYSELHAIYAGLWLGHTALGLLAARHADRQPLLGDVLALLIFSQAVGRGPCDVGGAVGMARRRAARDDGRRGHQRPDLVAGSPKPGRSAQIETGP